MLKQVRHISEGNFYGLRVTNKAQKLSLDREIRTLETWKDVQSHVFRKEEKELMSTLKRLEHSKQDHHHEDHDYPEKCSSSHHRRPSSFHSKHQLNSDKQEHLAWKPSERGQRKILVNVGTEISDAQSSSKVPCRVRVLTDTSDVNVIISLTPEASSVAAAATRQSDVASFPPLVERHKGDTGAEVHRTRGFMSCVICNLPRYNHGKEIPNTCSCPAHPSKHSLHVHHGHQASEKLKKLHTDDDNLKTHLAKRQKRLGTGDHFSPQPQLTRKQFSYQPDNTHYARSRTSSKEEDNKSHSPGSHRRIYKHNTTESEHRLHDREKRSRESSFGESKSWRSSLEESNRSLWSNYTEGRSRESSFGDNDNRSLKRRHGSRHRKHGHEEELYNLYKRLKRLFPSLWEDYHASKEDEEPKPVFSGLMHPDNIINHHHFLPYEAHQQDKEIPKPNKHHSAHDPFHPTSSHLVGIRKEVSANY